MTNDYRQRRQTVAGSLCALCCVVGSVAVRLKCCVFSTLNTVLGRLVTYRGRGRHHHPPRPPSFPPAAPGVSRSLSFDGARGPSHPASARISSTRAVWCNKSVGESGETRCRAQCTVFVAAAAVSCAYARAFGTVEYIFWPMSLMKRSDARRETDSESERECLRRSCVCINSFFKNSFYFFFYILRN